MKNATWNEFWNRYMEIVRKKKYKINQTFNKQLKLLLQLEKDSNPHEQQHLAQNKPRFGLMQKKKKELFSYMEQDEVYEVKIKYKINNTFT